MRHHFKETDEKPETYIDDGPEDEEIGRGGTKRKGNADEEHEGKKQRVEIPLAIEHIEPLPFNEWQQTSDPLQDNSCKGPSYPVSSFNNSGISGRDAQINQHHMHYNTHYNISSNMIASSSQSAMRPPVATISRPKNEAEGANWSPLGFTYNGSSAVSDPCMMKDMTEDDLIDPLLRWENKTVWDSGTSTLAPCENHRGVVGGMM